MVALRLLVGGLAALVTVVGLLLFLAWIAVRIAWELPDPAALTGPTVVVDRDGNELARFTAQVDRRVVPLDAMSPAARNAIIAAEDTRFFEHQGVDPVSLLRAVVSNVRTGGISQGGSTLTQQLVRGYFLPERLARENGDTLYPDGFGARVMSRFVGVRATNKLLRKLEEIRYALWLEDEFRRRFGSRERAKQEIFARYASFIYLGHGRYGFAAASQIYFGKPLKDLDRFIVGATRFCVFVCQLQQIGFRSPAQLLRLYHLFADFFDSRIHAGNGCLQFLNGIGFDQVFLHADRHGSTQSGRILFCGDDYAANVRMGLGDVPIRG